MNDSTSQNQRDRNSKRWQIITVAGILAVLGAGLWAWNSSQGTATAAPAPAHHKHHHKAGQQITVVPAAPAPAQAQPAAPAPAAPSGLTERGTGKYGEPVYANSVTSTAFALQVEKDYWPAGGDPFYSYSPVTGQSYYMTPSTAGASGSHGAVTTVTGGNGVVVQFRF
jgi:hypothetical protein